MDHLSLAAKHLGLQNQQKNAIGSIEKNYLKEKKNNEGVSAVIHEMLARFSGPSPFCGDFDFPQVARLSSPATRVFPDGRKGQFEI